VTGEELLGNDAECSEYYFPFHPRTKALGPCPAERFVKPFYVGADAAREAAEVFYRTAPAYVETLNTKHLKDYFDCDIFGLHLSPRNFVNSIVCFLDLCVRQAYPRVAKSPTLQPLEEGLEAMARPSSRKLPRITLLVKERTTPETLEILDKRHPLHG
jgi:hypothetical protein